jgi:hypothetical protein
VALIGRFDTPGSLRDLPAGHPFYARWHELVAGLIPDLKVGNPSGAFVDPSVADLDVVGERRLTWMGLPRTWLMRERDDRRAALEACERREHQDEYLEWHVTRRADGKITKVVLVTETPEYWTALARADPGTVVRLYREFFGRAVTRAQLFGGEGGSYDPHNTWNTERGIVHYVQRINTLADAVGLAARSVETPNEHDNLDASPAEPTSADPRVALDVGVLARKGLTVALRDPIGLYMVDWDDTGWTKPNGRRVGDYWRVRRGEPGAALRLEYQVPRSEGFVVGEIRIGGRPIECGGQIAEHVTVMTGAVAGAPLP